MMKIEIQDTYQLLYAENAGVNLVSSLDFKIPFAIN